MSEAAPETAQPAADTGQWPVLPTKTAIAIKCAALEKSTAELEAMAQGILPIKALDENGKEIVPVITTAEQATEAANFLTYGRRFLSGVDKRRLEYGAPAREFQADLNAEVALYTTRANAGINRISDALLKYQQKLRDEAAAAEKVRKEKAEKEALEAAAALEAQGNTAAANRVVEVAMSAPRRSATRAAAPPAVVSTVSGRKSTIRKDWKGEVVDLKGLLKAIVEGKVSVDGISVSQAWLNQLALAHGKEETVYGVKCFQKESLG